MNRGDIWTVAGGVYAAKPRPAVIIQDDLFASTNSVIVAPMTSALLDAPLMRIRIIGGRGSGGGSGSGSGDGDPSGLEHDSDVMVDKLTAVRRTNVHNRIGRVTAEQLVEIERAIMVFLGLAR